MINLVKISKSEKETHKIAGNLAAKIIKGPTSPRLAGLRRASVIALEGELGAGKTTFVKGFAKALGVKVKVKSPTFVLMKKYHIPENTRYKILISPRLLSCQRPQRPRNS